eukprot:scaffold1219_cov400-Prasinococcus_capsulatus_cf.AAC.5
MWELIWPLEQAPRAQRCRPRSPPRRREREGPVPARSLAPRAAERLAPRPFVGWSCPPLGPCSRAVRAPPAPAHRERRGQRPSRCLRSDCIVRAALHNRSYVQPAALPLRRLRRAAPGGTALMYAPDPHIHQV